MFLTYSSDDEENECFQPSITPKKRGASELKPNKAPAQELISEVRNKRRRILGRGKDREGGRAEGTKVQNAFFAAAKEEAKGVIEMVKRARGSCQKPAALAPVLPSLREKLLEDSSKRKKSSISFFSCNSQAYKASHDLRPENSQSYIIDRSKGKNKPKFSWDWATYRR
ncbi:hypothetical protein TWF506_000384 [Arthrobotrys conoides]|uniref:Uncharacterized protein n=1 Tax=Arthrobotrys conoides TaxID=74498 RepID=A0AAN8NKU9_9PEZI